MKTLKLAILVASFVAASSAFARLDPRHEMRETNPEAACTAKNSVGLTAETAFVPPPTRETRNVRQYDATRGKSQNHQDGFGQTGRRF
jgi:hypothetical protein